MLTVAVTIFEPGRPETFTLVSDVQPGISFLEFKQLLKDKHLIAGSVGEWKLGVITRLADADGEDYVGTKFLNSPEFVYSSCCLIAQRVSIPAVMVEIEQDVASKPSSVTTYQIFDAESKPVVFLDTCSLIANYEAKSAALRTINHPERYILYLTPRALLEWTNYCKKRAVAVNEMEKLFDINTVPDDFFVPSFKARLERLWVMFYTSILANFDLLSLGEAVVCAKMRENEHPGRPDKIVQAYAAAPNVPGRKLPADALAYAQSKNYVLDPARTKSDVLILFEVAAAGLLFKNGACSPVFYTKDQVFYTILQNHADAVKGLTDFVGPVRVELREDDIIRKK